MAQLIKSFGLITLFLASLACQSQTLQAQSNADYPKEWWTPVPREDAASWEILPQDAKQGEVILSKRTELGILSNFAPTAFEYRGVRYGSVEGFWQMMKYPEGADDERFKDKTIKWPHTRAEVAAMTAFDAKAAGNRANENMKKLGIKWVSFEGKKIEYLERTKGDFYKLIFDSMAAKMNQNPKVKEILKKTGDLNLMPDHHQSADSAPAWKYFDIWMELRQSI